MAYNHIRIPSNIFCLSISQQSMLILYHGPSQLDNLNMLFLTLKTIEIHLNSEHNKIEVRASNNVSDENFLHLTDNSAYTAKWKVSMTITMS